MEKKQHKNFRLGVFVLAILLVAITVAGLLSSCGVDSYPGTQVSTSDLQVTAAGNVTTLKTGDTMQLTAIDTSVDPAVDVTSQAVWSSSSNAKATVDSAGVVTGVSLGRVTITATYGTLVGTIDLLISNLTY